MPDLLRVSLMHVFGRGSTAPFRKALCTLTILFTTSGTFSWLFGRAVQQLPIVPHNQPWLVCIWIMAAACGCSVLSYAASSGLFCTQRTDKFSMLLHTMPLRQHIIWTVTMLPRLLVALLGLVLIAAPCWFAAHAWGVSTTWTLVAMITGYAIATAGLFIAGKLPLSAKGTRTSISDTATTYNWWFLKKMWRAPATRTSLVVSLLLSISAASFAAYRSFGDSIALSAIAALLSASFAADLRSLCRPINPAEIAALKGSYYFMVRYASAACVGAMLIAAPLLVPIVMYGSSDSGPWFLAVTQLLVGVGAGIISGAFIAPQIRDISGQFSAVLLCIGILVFPNYIPGLRSLQGEATTWITALLALTCMLFAYFFEHKRNPYFWRNHD